MAAAAFTPDPTTLYLGDNGRCYCGDHLGHTAKTTGRDLSGQWLFALDTEAVRLGRDEGDTFSDIGCETCGMKVAA